MQALKICLALYTVFPVRAEDWSSKHKSKALCYFALPAFLFAPFIAMIIAVYFKSYISSLTCAVLILFLRKKLSGYIHLDGFIDTVDALSSWGSKEKKAEILKDPHIGAFALIKAVFFILLNIIVLYELLSGIKVYSYATVSRLFFSALFIAAASRALSAYMAYSLPKAGSGMIKSCVRDAGKAESKIMLLQVLIFYLLAVVTQPIAGSLMLCASQLHFQILKKRFLQSFAGISGDLCGYYLETAEFTCDLTLAALLFSDLL